LPARGGQARELAERKRPATGRCRRQQALPHTQRTGPGDATDARQGFVGFVRQHHGEGEAPDNAPLFRRRLPASHADLSGPEYTCWRWATASTRHYCDFGRRAGDTLRSRGGGAHLFDIDLDVDGLDAGHPAATGQQLGQLIGPTNFSELAAGPLGNWAIYSPGKRAQPRQQRRARVLSYLGLEPLARQSPLARRRYAPRSAPQHPRGPPSRVANAGPLATYPQAAIAGESLLDILLYAAACALPKKPARAGICDALLALAPTGAPRILHPRFSADDALEGSVREGPGKRRQASGSAPALAWLSPRTLAWCADRPCASQQPGLSWPGRRDATVLIGNWHRHGPGCALHLRDS